MRSGSDSKKTVAALVLNQLDNKRKSFCLEQQDTLLEIATHNIEKLRNKQLR